MKALLAFAFAATALFATPAAAAVTLVADGLTYELDLNSITNGGLTGNFTLSISGINVVGTDTELGRTGINAIAFNDPAIGTAVSGIMSGFTFQSGGLNSGGCNNTGNFFCFSNSSFVFPSPLPSSGSISFSVTSDTVGSWLNWLTALKIDWTGSKNNYDLVSMGITVNDCTAGNCPTPTPFGTVPEPATWAMMLLGFFGIGMAVRRKAAGKLLQVA